MRQSIPRCLPKYPPDLCHIGRRLPRSSLGRAAFSFGLCMLRAPQNKRLAAHGSRTCSARQSLTVAQWHLHFLGGLSAHCGMHSVAHGCTHAEWLQVLTYGTRSLRCSGTHCGTRALSLQTGVIVAKRDRRWVLSVWHRPVAASPWRSALDRHLDLSALGLNGIRAGRH